MNIKNIKVLLVDDSSVVLMTEKMMLRQLDTGAVVTASNGREGVATAIRERPHLILMDVMMPEMNGFDAVRALRADPRTASIPVIMVTTRGEEDKVAEGYEAGCNDYLTKPIDKVQLLTKMRDLLEIE